ncbi:MAG: Mth938-like domain-containing protein, partial [Pseudomonadota bacterium]
MTDITPLIATDKMVITSAGPGRFTVSGTIYAHPIVITPQHVMHWAFAAPLESAVMALQDHITACEILLLGTGKTMHRLDATLMSSLQTHINI